jgi:hypothetical protein
MIKCPENANKFIEITFQVSVKLMKAYYFPKILRWPGHQKG